MARILVVEDDPSLRGVVTTTLRLAGHSVIEAETGREAASLLRRETPDVVLTDLVMPDQDGVGLIMEIREQYPDLPVIAMSGALANSPLYLDIATKLGARRILAKPFTSDELLKALTETLSD